MRQMCSVLDIADRENYFIMLDERNSDGNLIFKLYINRRDWERTNYEMDLRYVEHVLYRGFKNERTKTQFVLECDCRPMSMFYIKQEFFRRLINNVRLKFKNRLVGIHLTGSGNIWVMLSYWLMKDLIPISVQNKIYWN